MKIAISTIKNNILYLKGFTFLFGLRILQMGLGLATTYFLLRAVSVEQYGYYNFVISVVGTVSIFSLTEMNNMIIQSVARGYYGVYHEAIKRSFSYSLIGSLIAIAMAGYYAFIDINTELALALAIAGLIFPFSQALTLWKGLRLGEHKYKELTRLEGGNSIFAGFAVIASVLLLPNNYILPLFLTMAVPAVRNIIVTFYDLKKIGPGAIKEEGSMEYGLKASFYTGLNAIAANFDRLIIFYFLSPSALAMFSAADRLSDVFKNLTQDLSTTLAPKLAKSDGYTKRMDTIFRLYGIVSGALLIGFSFTVLPYVFVFIFSEKYAEAIPYAQALVCSVAIGNFSIMRFRYLRSKLDISSYKKVLLTQALSKIGFLAALVPFYGIWGAIASIYISRIMTALLIDHLMKKVRVF